MVAFWGILQIYIPTGSQENIVSGWSRAKLVISVYFSCQFHFSEKSSQCCLHSQLSTIKFSNIVQHILTGALEKTWGLHCQAHQGGAILERLPDVRPLALGNVTGKGDSPAGATGEVPGLDGAGVDLLAVVSQDPLGTPTVKELGGLRLVGQDLHLSVGFEIVNAGEVLLLRPAMEGHGLICLHMAQQTLDIHSHLAMLGSLGEEGAVKIAVDQACEVGVIRRSNGKPLGANGFVGFGQIYEV